MTDQPEKLDLRSFDIAEDKRQELLRLFPEVRTEGGKIDFERLRLALGETVDVGKERYGMNWPGKADCFKTIQVPSLGTLRPCPEESVNFDTTENLIIEGDNLEVLKLLQKSYLGKVKMIYIDPPYNTGNDFIYPDNYTESLQTYLEYTGQVDGNGKKFSTNTDTDGRFHSKWLNMMYPRLYLARNLLREDGAIFVSLDDTESSQLHFLMNEIFGEENFVGVFPWRSRTAKADVPFGVSKDVEWVISYAKPGFFAGRMGERKYYKSEDYKDRWRLSDLTTNKTAEQRPNSFFVMVNPKTQEQYPSDPTRTWAVTQDTFFEYYQKGKIVFPGDYPFLNITKPYFRVFESEDKEKALLKHGTEEVRMSISTYLPEKEVGRTEDGSKEIRSLFGSQVFSYPKPVGLLQFFIKNTSQKDDIILDFFAGSGTTAQAVLELNKQDGGNRKFILVQLPEQLDPNDNDQKTASDFCDSIGKPRNIAEITKERVRRVIKKLNDEDAAREPSLFDENRPEQDRGFRVFKLAESNFKPWNAGVPHDEKVLAQQLELHIDHIRQGRTQEDILYEILLKSGFPLTAPVERLTLAGKTVYSVAEGALFICLERQLTLELIRAMAERRPERVVCLDEGFAGNDQLKANAVQVFKTKGVTSFKTV
ncbi:MAG: site-specific DNA-methyltransferase [Clostridia bacterium]|nr:MAG: site-specific DNA-methyltransferase [Clostridia bacterium]